MKSPLTKSPDKWNGAGRSLTGRKFRVEHLRRMIIIIVDIGKTCNSGDQVESLPRTSTVWRAGGAAVAGWLPSNRGWDVSKGAGGKWVAGKAKGSWVQDRGWLVKPVVLAGGRLGGDRRARIGCRSQREFHSTPSRRGGSGRHSCGPTHDHRDTLVQHKLQRCVPIGGRRARINNPDSPAIGQSSHQGRQGGTSALGTRRVGGQADGERKRVGQADRQQTGTPHNPTCKTQMMRTKEIKRETRTQT
jgi:hypothetical protein